jgi:hypothetical protein
MIKKKSLPKDIESLFSGFVDSFVLFWTSIQSLLHRRGGGCQQKNRCLSTDSKGTIRDCGTVCGGIADCRHAFLSPQAGEGRLGAGVVVVWMV